MATNAETVELVRGLAEVLATHRLDRVQVGDVVLTRTVHITPEDVARAAIAAQKTAADDEESLLFHSAGGA